jgi:hypothetical protein
MKFMGCLGNHASICVINGNKSNFWGPFFISGGCYGACSTQIGSAKITD